LNRPADPKLPHVQLLFSALSAYSGGKTMLGGVHYTVQPVEAPERSQDLV